MADTTPLLTGTLLGSLITLIIWVVKLIAERTKLATTTRQRDAQTARTRAEQARGETERVVNEGTELKWLVDRMTRMEQEIVDLRIASDDCRKSRDALEKQNAAQELEIRKLQTECRDLEGKVRDLQAGRLVRTLSFPPEPLESPES
nr:hypothetical protein [uncultured Rhodopila sp.]